MNEYRTQAELEMFYRLACAYPKMWEVLENSRLEHKKLGSGMVASYVPARNPMSDPKIEVRFDDPKLGPKPILLSLPLVFDKGLLESLVLSSDAFATFGVGDLQRCMGELRKLRLITEENLLRARLSPPGASTEPLATLKEGWLGFREALERHRIEHLYHFTDSRNLPSIRERGGLFSWLQCRRRGINIAAPGGDYTSRRLDVRNGLEDYVRLSFNAAPPMMFRALREGRICDVEVLRVDPSVVYLAGTLFSDANANAAGATVGGDLQSLERVRFDVAKRTDRTSEYEKRYRQAEVLVKGHLPISLIDNL